MKECISNIFDYIISNIDTIKDALWIVFTFVATLIAVLTYKRARYSVLQPLRTEVIKRQTDLLVELLDYLKDEMAFISKVDYNGIVELNTYLLMKEYGFVLNDEESAWSGISKAHAGALILKKEGKLSSVELPRLFGEKQDVEEVRVKMQEENKKKYIKAKNGQVDLELLYLTKENLECTKKISEFIDNPFLPTKIKKLLEELQEDISYNLTVVMKKTFEDFILKLCETAKSASTDNPILIQHQALYNEFQRESRTPKDTINKTRSIVREYLMIDKKWEQHTQNKSAYY